MITILGMGDLERSHRAIALPPRDRNEREIAELQAKGWTVAAIADAAGVRWLASDRWWKGIRTPANAPAVVVLLRQLKRWRAPPRRRTRR